MINETAQIKKSIENITEHYFMKRLLSMFFSQTEIDSLFKFLRSISDKKSFMMEFSYILANRILEKTTTDFSYEGIENIDAQQKYLYISNHSNIIMDATMLNYALKKENKEYAVMAIGDNLIVDDFTKEYFYLSDCFVIKRALTPKELLISSLNISSFMRSKIVNDENSVWIAQKEGRTKDGIDKTQTSILKMLSMSDRKQSLIQGLSPLRKVFFKVQK